MIDVKIEVPHYKYSTWTQTSVPWVKVAFIELQSETLECRWSTVLVPYKKAIRVGWDLVPVSLFGEALSAINFAGSRVVD